MKEMKSLARETAIYGLSSMLGRFLNWLLVPLYTFVLASSADYGIVTNLYAWTALLIVILTYGMETGLFRFINREDQNPTQVYSTTLICVGTTSLIAIAGFAGFAPSISRWLGYEAHSEFVAMMGIIVSIDAFDCIPFAYLRYRRRAIKFAALKLLGIFVNIACNLFFLIGCPRLMQTHPEWIDWFFRPDYGVGYVFVSNMISTGVITVCLLPDILRAGWDFNRTLLAKMLRYSLPLLILGVAGIMNQTLDKILFPFLYKAGDAQAELGIYGACFKIAMVMMMFTQAFRYAYEPFIFAKHKDKNSVETYADAMKYFVIFSLLILLGMVFYLDLIKHIISPAYWVGLKVVPVVLWSYVFQGIFFNLSLWYKLTDKTMYGAWFSIGGLVITLIVNLIFVPTHSYMASAWASFACFSVIMVLSYLIGRKYYPVPYDLKSIGFYMLLTVVMLLVSHWLKTGTTWLDMLLNTGLLTVYCAVVFLRDFRALVRYKFNKNTLQQPS